MNQNKNSGLRILVLSGLILLVAGQTDAQTLEARLKEAISSCADLIADGEDEKLKAMYEDKEILDVANGHAHVSGTYPTCGCYCKTDVAAYRDDKGDYTILRTDFEACDARYGFSADRPLEDVLPEGFGIRTFWPDYVENDQVTEAMFAYDVLFDRESTELEIALQFIWAGIRTPASELVSPSYSAFGHDPIRSSSFSPLKVLVDSLADERTIDLLLAGDSSSISPVDQRLLEEELFDHYDMDFAKLTAELNILKARYDVLMQLEYENILLDWDRKTARFYIKAKEEVPQEKFSFREFLAWTEYWWGPAC